MKEDKSNKHASHQQNTNCSITNLCEVLLHSERGVVSHLTDEIFNRVGADQYYILATAVKFRILASWDQSQFVSSTRYREHRFAVFDTVFLGRNPFLWDFLQKVART